MSLFDEMSKANWHAEPTGWAFMDHITGGGMKDGSMGVLIAPRKTGKTYFITNWIYRLIRNRVPVYFFSAELPRHVIVSRILQIMYGKEWKEMRRSLDQEGAAPYREGIDFIDYYCKIDETRPLPVGHVREVIDVNKGDYKWYFIDHHMQLSLGGRERGIYDEVTGVFRIISNISQVHPMRLIVAVQANVRGASKVAEGAVMPSSSMGKGSGEIEQCSNYILTMCNPGGVDMDVEADRKQGIIVQVRPGHYNPGGPPVFLPYLDSSEIVEVKKIF